MEKPVYLFNFDVIFVFLHASLEVQLYRDGLPAVLYLKNFLMREYKPRSGDGSSRCWRVGKVNIKMLFLVVPTELPNIDILPRELHLYVLIFARIGLFTSVHLKIHHSEFDLSDVVVVRDDHHSRLLRHLGPGVSRVVRVGEVAHPVLQLHQTVPPVRPEDAASAEALSTSSSRLPPHVLALILCETDSCAYPVTKPLS